MKVGICIPTTSRGKQWKSLEDSFIYNILLPSLTKTLTNNHEYHLYFGVDSDDELLRYLIKLKPEWVTSFNVIEMKNIKKGNVVGIWNQLANEAIRDECEYLYICGDDIYFTQKGWLDASIHMLQLNNDIGVSGPTDVNNPRLKLTQLLIHKSHIRKLGYVFPPEITNWYCDDYIVNLYEELNLFFPLNNFTCMNLGGQPRYEIVDCKPLMLQLVNRDKYKLLRKVIAFSLYGDHPVYTYGAIENVLLSTEIYPGWIVQIYYNYTVPLKIIEALRQFKHVELIEMYNHNGNKNMLWRLLSFFDPKNDLVIIRDCDSRLNIREASCINEWVSSTKKFHVMRDHKDHAIHIMGGMCGGYTSIMRMFENDFYMYEYLNKIGDDQNFLNKVVYPLLKKEDNIFIHDEKTPINDGVHKFPTVKYNGYVGQVVEDIAFACSYLKEKTIIIKSQHNGYRRNNKEIPFSIKFITEDDFVKSSNYAISRKLDNLGHLESTALKQIGKKQIIALTGYNNIVGHFFDNILPCLLHPVILVLIESDIINLTKDMLNNPKIKHIFTWNKIIEHPKCSYLPIGLNYDRQYASLMNYMTLRIKKPKTKFCLLNFNNNTNVKRNEYFAYAKTWPFCTLVAYDGYLKSYTQESHTDGKITISVTKPSTYAMMDDYQFILCPHGAGLDTHRVWECLYLDCIPVVLSSPLDDLYSDLPVIIVNSLDEINQEFLINRSDNIQYMKDHNQFNMDKLQLNYWLNKIYSLNI